MGARLQLNWSQALCYTADRSPWHCANQFTKLRISAKMGKHAKPIRAEIKPAIVEFVWIVSKVYFPDGLPI